jgi:hypothetical protein
MDGLLKNKTMSIQKILFDTPGKISIKLEDGRIILVPLKYFPELQKLSPEERKKYTIVDDRTILFAVRIQFTISKILSVWKANGVNGNYTSQPCRF